MAVKRPHSTPELWAFIDAVKTHSSFLHSQVLCWSFKPFPVLVLPTQMLFAIIVVILIVPSFSYVFHPKT